MLRLRVLEFGRGVAAAWCGKLLTELGAEVVRVDPPRDPGAYIDPLFERALDLHLHRGKRRVALDYSEARGRALLDRIAAGRDALVTDESPARLDRLSFRELGGEAPGLRVCITPYGLSGPDRDSPATAATLLAQAGHSYLTGDPGRAPLSLPGHYPDVQAGQFACIGLLSAWLARRRETTPTPRLIEVSALECLASLSQFTTVLYTYMGRVRTRHGNRWENLHPISLYPCADGWLMVNVVPGFWDAFTFFLGEPALRDDPRFATSQARLAHAAELDALIRSRFATRCRAELTREAQETFRVPVGELQTPEELLADAQLAARGFFETLDSTEGELRAPGRAFRILDHDPAAPERD